MSLRPALLSLALLSPAAAQAPTWHTDLATAQAQAAREKKPLLIDFTGSEWCPYCILLDKEVFSTPAFAAWTGKAVLLKLDYPPKAARSPEGIQANPALQKLMALKERFKVASFPTVILLGPDGQERTRTSGYKKGTGPEAWLTPFGL